MSPRRSIPAFPASRPVSLRSVGAWGLARCPVVLGYLLLSTVLASANEPPTTAVAFPPDGDFVVAASQSGLRVLTWPDLRPQRTIEVLASNVHCLAFSPQGDRLAVGGGYPSVEGIVEIFSWPDTKSGAALDGHEDSVVAIAWLDAHKLVTASQDREITMWDLRERAPASHYSGHSRGVSAICLLPGGRTLLSGGDDQSVRVWDIQSEELVRSLNQHTASIHALALRPDQGRLPMVASAAADRTIRFWQPTIGRMIRYVRLEAEPLNIAWLDDGLHIVASCVDGHIRVVNADDVRVTQTVPAINGWAYALAVHPSDGSVAVGGSDGTIRRIDLQRTSP